MSAWQIPLTALIDPRDDASRRVQESQFNSTRNTLGQQQIAAEPQHRQLREQQIEQIKLHNQGAQLELDQARLMPGLMEGYYSRVLAAAKPPAAAPVASAQQGSPGDVSLTYNLQRRETGGVPDLGPDESGAPIAPAQSAALPAYTGGPHPMGPMPDGTHTMGPMPEASPDVRNLPETRTSLVPQFGSAPQPQQSASSAPLNPPAPPPSSGFTVENHRNALQWLAQQKGGVLPVPMLDGFVEFDAAPDLVFGRMQGFDHDSSG